MAAAIWIVRGPKPDSKLIDGIDVVFIQDDSVDTEATVLADTHAAVIAAGHAIPAAGYFTSAVLTATAMSTDLDLVIGFGSQEVIA